MIDLLIPTSQMLQLCMRCGKYREISVLNTDKSTSQTKAFVSYSHLQAAEVGTLVTEKQRKKSSRSKPGEQPICLTPCDGSSLPIPTLSRGSSRLEAGIDLVATELHTPDCPHPSSSLGECSAAAARLATDHGSARPITIINVSVALAASATANLRS